MNGYTDEWGQFFYGPGLQKGAFVMVSNGFAGWARYVFTPIALLSFVAGGLITTLTGPLGSYAIMGTFERAMFWFSLIGVSIVLARTIELYVDIHLSKLSFLMRATVTLSSFSALFTGFILLKSRMLFGHWFTPDISVWMIFGIVVSVSLTVRAFMLMVQKMMDKAGDQAGASLPRLLRRLPEGRVGRLVRVSVEDHYVHVVTERGLERLLMRFGDALDELDEQLGLQVHRSHWVAYDAIDGCWIDGGRVILKLSDGSEVPVSRNYRRQVELAGILAPHKTSASAHSGELQLA